MEYYGGCLLQATFALALLPALHANVINYRLMIPTRTRNYSLKTLKPDRRDEGAREERAKEELLRTKAKLLPTIAENRQLQKMQAKELGINIKRFQGMAQQQKDEVSEELVRAAYFVLKSFSEVDNNFRDVFADLHIRVKEFLFLNDPELSIKYRLKEGVSYRKTVRMMQKTNGEWLHQKDERISELETLVLMRQQEGRNEAERLNIECFQLREEVEKYKKIANVEYVRSLERKVEDLKETVSTQEDDYKVLAKKNEESSLEIEQLRKEVGELQVSCAQLEEKVYDLSVVRQRTELYLLRTKDRFDELHNRMGALKEVIAKVERENETLVAERMQLVNRAAVSFEDLTPRPKYGDYYLLDRNTHLNSTSQIFNCLIEAYEGSKDQLFEKYFLAKRNRKLMEIEAIREKTVRQLEDAKGELNKMK